MNSQIVSARGKQCQGKDIPLIYICENTSCSSWICHALIIFLFIRFYETISKGVDREGWTRGGIQPQQAGGFATNNHGTDLGSDPNATETLRTVHPHVGRWHHSGRAVSFSFASLSHFWCLVPFLLLPSGTFYPLLFIFFQCFPSAIIGQSQQLTHSIAILPTIVALLLFIRQLSPIK